MSRWTRPALVWLLTSVVGAGSAQASPQGQPPSARAAAEPAYVLRGHRAEAQQRALKARLDRMHDALEAALDAAAPDLLPQLEPPPSPTPGYQQLPRLVDDPPPQPLTTPQVMHFSWAWSETLIATQMTALDTLEQQLAAVPRQRSTAAHAACEAALARYQQVVRDRRPIDADIDYNWLWQREIQQNPARFDEQTRRLERTEAAQKAGTPIPADIAASLGSADPPDYVRIAHPDAAHYLVTVPVVTDIADAQFVDSVRDAIERYWHVDQNGIEYRVRLQLSHISSNELYCGGVDAAAAAPCVPPAAGAPIDVNAHVARFQKGRAVLTTGAGTVYVAAGRAMLLGPHDVTPRTLAHEFGHILGFGDGYLRGYHNRGDDGFEVLELVVAPTDIMSNPGAGSIAANHFDQLARGREIQQRMSDGVTALYTTHDAPKASALFRDVLALMPTHYGATLQLAKALDAGGQPNEALVWWRRILAMAEQARDDETVTTARLRLAEQPH